MSHRCIYPNCPESCCQCSHAVPESAYSQIHGPSSGHKCISSQEIEEQILQAMDDVGPEHWHSFIRRPGVRHLIAALLSAQTHIEHHEEAARLKAKAACALAEKIFSPPSPLSRPATALSVPHSLETK